MSTEAAAINKGTNFEKLLSFHTGLYNPAKFQAAKSEDAIRVTINKEADIINAENPRDACKYLALEVVRCRESHNAASQPERAFTSCLKWEDQLKQCQWDQEKVIKGYTYIDPVVERHNKLWFSLEQRFA